jgi:hypothetical protein
MPKPQAELDTLNAPGAVTGDQMLSSCPERGTRPNYPPVQNGCGSAQNDVPDEPLLWGACAPFDFTVSFTGACNTHDICYGTCKQNKTQCDLALESNMANSCDAGIPAEFATCRAMCYKFAYSYLAGLTVLPQAANAYANAQAEACICCSSQPTP